MIWNVLKPLFEKDLLFSSKDQSNVYGNAVYIGQTEFLAVEILRDDEEAYGEEFITWLDGWKTAKADRLSELLAIHDNKHRFDDLLTAVRQRQVVPFLGSGTSASTGLPTWRNLLLQIARSTGYDEDEINNLCDRGKFEEAASVLATNVNARLLNEQIDHKLRFVDNLVTPVTLLAACHLTTILTTNLDCILEQALDSAGFGFTNVLSGAQIGSYRNVRSTSSRILLKIHGTAKDPDSYVLTEDQYDAAYSVGGTTRDELSLIYRNNSLLFCGCSLTVDRTLSLLGEVANNDSNMPKHFAFLQENEVGYAQRENTLTGHGIFPIWYDGDHDSDLWSLIYGVAKHYE